MENVLDAKTYNLSPSAAVAYFRDNPAYEANPVKWCLGTGNLGNSIMYGIMSSARTSLLLAIICAAINMTIGILVGAIWGYSKRFDAVMLVNYNIIANVPYILLISVLVYIIGSGFWPFVFALTVTGWLGIAYFFRTQVMIIRDREYSLASRCLGTPVRRVITKNILPFLTSVIVTLLATELPSYISYEVFLSFIGIGLSASVPSLGRMIQQAQSAFMTYPWAFWPPVAIASAITILLYLLGQNLADASDPRTHM
jgi:oligopeptide transport system permease protein